MIFCELAWGGRRGYGWGVVSLPTCLQRYCDPASLVEWVTCSLGWSGIRVKFQKNDIHMYMFSSLLQECSKLGGLPTSRGLNLKIKSCRQHYKLPMAMKRSP